MAKGSSSFLVLGFGTLGLRTGVNDWVFIYSAMLLILLWSLREKAFVDLTVITKV
jgi:hypothetical protein